MVQREARARLISTVGKKEDLLFPWTSVSITKDLLACSSPLLWVRSLKLSDFWCSPGRLSLPARCLQLSQCKLVSTAYNSFLLNQLQQRNLLARVPQAAPALARLSNQTHFEPPHCPLLFCCIVVVVPNLPTEQVEGVQPVLKVIKLCFQLFVEDLR